MAINEVQRDDRGTDNEQAKQPPPDIGTVNTNESYSNNSNEYDQYAAHEEPRKMTFWEMCKEPGSAIQIIAAALLAVAIALPVAFEVDPSNSRLQAASTILNIPGRLWLRALTAVVMPLIATAMILAMQRLKEMTGGGSKLAKWSVGYYVATSIIAIVHATILISLVWRPIYTTVSDADLEVDEGDQDLVDERSKNDVTDIVVNVFDSFIPSNIFQALANNQLLAILVTAVVVGGLLKPRGSLMKAVIEVVASWLRRQPQEIEVEISGNKIKGVVTAAQRDAIVAAYLAQNGVTPPAGT